MLLDAYCLTIENNLLRQHFKCGQNEIIKNIKMSALREIIKVHIHGKVSDCTKEW